MGTIDTKSGVYHVESAKKYHIENAESIIYHEKDLLSDEKIKNYRKKMNLNMKNKDGTLGCGARYSEILKDLQKEQKKVTENLQRNKKVKI